MIVDDVLLPVQHLVSPARQREKIKKAEMKERNLRYIIILDLTPDGSLLTVSV